MKFIMVFSTGINQCCMTQTEPMYMRLFLTVILKALEKALAEALFLIAS